MYMNKLTGADDIQDWIKKVQEASDRAAAVTFGHKYTGGSHGNGMATAMATVDALHDHDEAYQEAQELLNQWMTDKCHLDNDFDDDMDEILSSRNPPTRSEIKKQWDDLIAVEDPGFPHPYNGISSEAFAKEIEERDEESTVEGIIQGLLDKPVVETDFLRDLGLDERKKKGKDPTISMQARHQRVKENREKRQKERERELREKQRRKDAQLQAQQIILKEERDKAMHKRKEETLLQQEMTKIRKEMEEQRRVAEEVQRREQERWEAEKRREREERELQQRKAELRKHQAQQMLEEERKELTRRLEEMKAKKATEDLKCLRRHFSAWYQLVANRRIQMGKARALSDWRRLVRAWNKWRHYVRQQRMEYEERRTEFYIRESHRKKQLAEDFHRKTLLKRYFVSWQLWVAQEQQSRELTERRQETKNKMAAFLEAAASGKLWTNRKEDDSLFVDDLETPHSNRSSDRPDSTRQKVDDLFDQPARRLQNHSIPSTGRSDWSLQDTQSRKAKPLEKPKFAWQVTRKHVNLTPEQLANRGDSEQNNAMEYGHENLQKEMDMGRSRKIPYTINNFEHRYAAQQQSYRNSKSSIKNNKN
ncbi:coiled-coil domain-containing protein 191-like isoform X3 [Ptychodera flava]|uniref:coiled-coil domain-containing protein 191-like isoform X3 n=1 Tax=Ptychodera flava TaxID=63121 RepID=UPI00396A5FD8